MSKHKTNLTIKSRISEWKYWNVTRHTRKFVPWLARKLPTQLKYYVVIHGMVTVEPEYEPNKVTGMEMLDLWKK